MTKVFVEQPRLHRVCLLSRLNKTYPSQKQFYHTNSKKYQIDNLQFGVALETKLSLKWDEGKKTVSVLVHFFFAAIDNKFRIYALHSPLRYFLS